MISIDPGVQLADGLHRVRDLVEKPARGEASSDLAIVGRYILTPDIFGLLTTTASDHTGEIQLTDALRSLLPHRPVYAYEFKGIRHDTGNKLGFLRAVVYFALRHPELAEPFAQYLRSLDLHPGSRSGREKDRSACPPLRFGMTPRLRIGFFTDSYLPATPGVEVSIETFRKNLERAGHQVFVYTPAVPGYTDSNRRVFRLKSMRVIETPEMRLAFPVVEDGNIRELTRLPLDIVHVHTPFTVGLLGKYIATHQHVPIIYTHHTHYPEYAKAYLKERVVLPFLAKSLSAWFSNISDAVIAPSPKIRALLRSYGVRRPIYVVPTGIRLQQFRRTRTSGRKARALRLRLGIALDAKVLLFVGRLGREKNIDFVIRAFAKLTKMRREVRLVLTRSCTWQNTVMLDKLGLGSASFLSRTCRIRFRPIESL